MWRHQLKIGSKILRFVDQVQLAVKILKSGTIITLVQKIFIKEGFLNFEILILIVTSLFRNWKYQCRTYIWDAFFNFLKLLKVLITDSAGYLSEELLLLTLVSTEHHQWLAINAQAYYSRPELSNFDKIVERRDKQSHWLTYFL